MNCGSFFFAEIRRMTSSLRPGGTESDSMSVTKPHLYSRLASSSTVRSSLFIDSPHHDAASRRRFAATPRDAWPDNISETGTRSRARSTSRLIRAQLIRVGQTGSCSQAPGSTPHWTMLIGPSRARMTSATVMSSADRSRL